MGNPAFCYTPTDGATLETVDLGEALQDIQEDPGVLRQDSFAGDGTMFTHQVGDKFGVRIMLERFGTAGTSSLERQLSTMLNHLQRGGCVYFTRDTAKGWASLVGGGPSRGNTSLPISGNLLSGLWSSGTLASGDEVVIEAESPVSSREFVAASSVTGSTLTLSAGLTYDYSDLGGTLYTIARWRDCYPGLYLLADDARGQKIRPDARRNWTLDLPLYWSPASFIGALRALTYARFDNGFGSVPGTASVGISALPIKTSTTMGLGLDAITGGRPRKRAGAGAKDLNGSHTGTLK